MLTKILADTKKENNKLKEEKLGLQKRISDLEQELKEAEEKYHNKEQLWIKAFEASSPKNIQGGKGEKQFSFAGVNLRNAKSPPARIGMPQTGPAQGTNAQQRGKVNYKQNMKTMIHQKYMKKLEDQQKLFEKRFNELRLEFASQIEEMTEQVAEA